MKHTTSKKRGSAQSMQKKKGVRKNKYNAQGIYLEWYGEKKFFHSKAEGERAKQLQILWVAGKITNLTLQPKFNCVVNNVKICQYRADFEYDTVLDNKAIGNRVIEDVKGQVTDIYKIKKKLVESLYGIKIHEIPSKEIEKWENIIPENI
jgi:hypothetical protein